MLLTDTLTSIVIFQYLVTKINSISVLNGVTKFRLQMELYIYPKYNRKFSQLLFGLVIRWPITDLVLMNVLVLLQSNKTYEKSISGYIYRNAVSIFGN